jgi:hypothetical protein
MREEGKQLAIKRVALPCLCILLLHTMSLFAARALSPSQAPPSSPQATTRISGQVTSATSGRPIRKVLVRALSPKGLQLGAATTDGFGRFEILNLPPDRYTLRTNKTAYVPLAFDQRNEFDAPTPIDLTQKNRVEGLHIKLVPGAAIAGTVVDELGEPMAAVRVTPYRFRYVRGRKQISQGGSSAITDDLGQFRTFGLLPGDYTVAAILPIMVGGPDDGDSGYATTFAPGTTNYMDTQPIRLSAGTSATHIEIALIPSRVSRVSGTLVDSDGASVGYGIVSLENRFTNSPVAIGQVGIDGTFTITGVPPGDYFLKSNAQSGQVPRVARLPVSVGDQDLVGIRLAPLTPIAVRGRIHTDSQIAGPLPKDLRVDVIRLLDDGLAELRPSPSPVRDDGTFELSTFEGRVKLNLSGLEARLGLKAVRLAELDVTDGLDIEPRRQSYHFDLEITDRLPRVRGQVVNGKGEPITDYNVVVFARDESLWGWQSRHVVLAAPNPKTHEFDAGPMPAGNYYIIAVPRFRDDQWADPDYLMSMSRLAKRISLADGEVAPINITITNSQ